MPIDLESTTPPPPRRAPLRRILGSLLLLPVVAVASAAFGSWSAGGAGAGSGATATTVAITLSPGTPSAALHPGSQAHVELSASNPNTSPVHVGSLVLDASQGTGGLSVDAGHPGCAVSSLSFSTQTNGGAGWTVPGRVAAVDGVLAVTLTDALAMDVGAASACQGASFTVWLVAGP